MPTRAMRFPAKSPKALRTRLTQGVSERRRMDRRPVRALRRPSQNSWRRRSPNCRIYAPVLERGEIGKQEPRQDGGFRPVRTPLRLGGGCSRELKLQAALGNDYLVSPDVVVARALCEDDEINRLAEFVDDSLCLKADLRKKNGGRPILHASISAKWTMRSDRAQNSRTEALNLMRDRKGRVPHIMVVTAEPSPSRIASLALGTGDIDCVYHFALYELLAAAEKCSSKSRDEAMVLLNNMIDGKRLKDISDLPLDLAC